MTAASLEIAREIETRCAKVGLEKMKGFWENAQEAERKFWLEFTPERLEAPRRQWKSFAEFLHVAAKQFVPLDADSKILQVGTAVLDAIYFFPEGRRFSADPLTNFYKTRLAWAYESTLDVTAVEAPCERLPFEDRAFSMVILNNMLDHVFEPSTALREARRVLRDDGLLFVGVNVFPSELCPALRTDARYDPCHPYVFSPDDVLAFLRSTGFHPIASKLHDPTDPAAPDERYFAVFALVQAPRNVPREVPGGGWRFENTGGKN
ncbi:MAG: class I SAM-dependent methyltransferase [Planctomycetes bacterium]|nr:class I SAM-dependent methyltransferase [Planctomycetota bacterium]